MRLLDRGLAHKIRGLPSRGYLLGLSDPGRRPGRLTAGVTGTGSGVEAALSHHTLTYAKPAAPGRAGE